MHLQRVRLGNYLQVVKMRHDVNGNHEPKLVAWQCHPWPTGLTTAIPLQTEAKIWCLKVAWLNYPEAPYPSMRYRTYPWSLSCIRQSHGI